jgi:hypothetical protein
MRTAMTWATALSADEQAAFLGGTCARFYGLESPT